jgi:hypothetical protein
MRPYETPYVTHFSIPKKVGIEWVSSGLNNFFFSSKRSLNYDIISSSISNIISKLGVLNDQLHKKRKEI